jgi:fatty-acyl-CoA synthase
MRTLVDILRENANLPDRAITFVRASGDEVVVPFPEVFRKACQRAAAFGDLGIVKGDRVALVLPDPEEFVLTFLGALVAGIVAVPIYPPATMAKLDAYGETFRHVLEASGTKLIVTSEGLLPMLAKELPEAATTAEAGNGALRLLPESAIRGEDQQGEDRFAVSPDDLAFLQFTSGSTSRPKGVLVTHGSLSANAHGIMVDGLKARDGDRGVCWLPLYHDMGLIGFVVAPLFAQVEVMFLPTASFVRRPSLWLDAIHRFRGTITFAPNFAYALATRSVQDRQTTAWDLSCLRVLGCGAEPIQASVLSGFVERFAPQGLSSSSLLPCYGMAEATLAITFHELGEPIRVDRIAVEDLRRGFAVPASAGDRVLELVGCGRPFPGHEVAIVGAGNAALGERQVGEIAFRGPSVTKGYFADAAATEATFDTSIDGRGRGWLRTGDLGYLVDGELFVCGREKDLLILNGKNYFPEDIERVAATVEGIREGHIVAFSCLAASGQERAVIVAEGRKELDDSVENAVIQAVRSHLGLTIDEVRLIKRGTLPKTSSGKVRRKEARRRLEEDLLEAAPPPAPVVVPVSPAPVPAVKIQHEVEVSHGIE